MPLKLNTLFFTLLLLVACATKKQDKETVIVEKPLQETATQLKLGENLLVLQTYLWRDFMPSVGTKSKSPLLSKIKLIDRHEKPIPPNLHLKKQYLIQGDKVWEFALKSIRAQTPYERVAVLRDGPQLKPGTEVDVVCELEYEGKRYRIAAKSQEIRETH